MSTREDQPATVPPPDGEDDAYSATTKVGAMPADIMEKLRAEGLLPDDVEQEEKAKAAEREKRIAALRPAVPRPEGAAPPSGPVPQLYSSPPAALDGYDDENNAETRFVQSPNIETTPPPAQPLAAPIVDSTETPVAFAFPPNSQIPRAAEPVPTTPPAAAPASSLPVPPPQVAAAMAQKPQPKGPSKVVMAIVALAAVVLLIVALMRLRG